MMNILLLMTALVATGGGVTEAEMLAGGRLGQVSEGVFATGSGAMLPKGGWVLLDFGREMHGSVKLGCGAKSGRKARVRIRLGESVAEAMSELGERGSCNDHAIRDDVIALPWFGSRTFGESGFRFVRVDNVSDDPLQLEYVLPVPKERAFTRTGAFRSSDARLNAVYETCLRTAELCAQEYLWDGIKRDRLVWIGDLHPELRVMTTVHGDEKVLYDTLEYAIATTPDGHWMNGSHVSYTCWFLMEFCDLWRTTGSLDFARKHLPYLKRTTDRLIATIREDGSIDFPYYFLDWPTRHNPDAEKAGAHALLKWTLDRTAELADALGERPWAATCRDAAARLTKSVPTAHGSKQAASLLALSGLRDAKAEFAGTIGADGHRGVSTFYGYYMLEAMAKAGEYQRALSTIRDYWGAMLDMGATSFWEGFDIAWTNNAFRIDQMPVAGKKDIHGDYGEFCYQGFRHSLCHGWSSGPAAWLVNNVLGLTFAEPGGRRVRFEPHLGDLDWVEGAIWTPKGAVKVSVRRDGEGKTVKKVLSCPEGVEVTGVEK